MTRHQCLAMILAFCLAAILTACKKENPPPSKGIDIDTREQRAEPTLNVVARIPASGYAIDLDENLVILGYGESLEIIDIADIANPQTRGRTRITKGAIRDVDYSWGYVFVATLMPGLEVVDAREPSKMTLLSTWRSKGAAMGVRMVGATAYLAEEYGLKILNMKNPMSPELIGQWDSPNQITDIHVTEDGGLVYLTDAYKGLMIIETSDAASPQLLGSVDTPTYAAGLGVSGSYAFVGDDASGVHVIDISSSVSPKLIASVDTPGEAADCAVIGTNLYVSDLTAVRMIDVSNPQKPAMTKQMLPQTLSTRLATNGQELFIPSLGELIVVRAE